MYGKALYVLISSESMELTCIIWVTRITELPVILTKTSSLEGSRVNHRHTFFHSSLAINTTIVHDNSQRLATYQSPYFQCPTATIT